MLACLPSAAWAEVCDKERPFWDGTPVNMFEEIFGQLTNPFTAIVVISSVFLVMQSKQVFILLGVFLIAVYAVVFVDPLFLDDVKWEAKQEGCIGNQELWWTVLAGICLFGLYRATRTFLRARI